VDAGARAGVHLTLSASAVSRWEAGTYEPALRYRRHLAEALAVPEAELFRPPSGMTELGPSAGSPPPPAGENAFSDSTY
jgi:transcriptional regulator with XRE-family HTH domain